MTQQQQDGYADGYADEYASRSVEYGGAPGSFGDDDNDMQWAARLEPGKFEAYMRYKTFATFESYSSQSGVFRSADFTPLQTKLARHKNDFGARQKAAPCNRFPQYLAEINRALRIYESFQQLGRQGDPPSGKHLSIPELVAYNTCSAISFLDDSEGEARLKREIKILERKRNAVVRRLSRSLEDGSFRDYQRLQELRDDAGERPFVGTEVDTVLDLLPEVHRQVYDMGRSTEKDTENMHLETIATNHPIRALMRGASPEGERRKGRMGGLFGRRRRNNFAGPEEDMDAA